MRDRDRGLQRRVIVGVGLVGQPLVGLVLVVLGVGRRGGVLCLELLLELSLDG